MKHNKLYLLAALLMTLGFLPAAHCNLIGFDFGSRYMKATLVKAGKPFSIIENTASKRKTETWVTIGSENRVYGADSMLESGKYPKTTFNELARTFGRSFDSDWISKFKQEKLVFNQYVSDDRGYIAWKITRPAHGDSEPSDEILYSEEIVATMFGYVKMLAEI